jgi:hypothetical protein
MRPLPLSLLAAGALATCGCAGTDLGVATTPAPSAAASVPADTLVQVAQRIYNQEVAGSVGRANVRRIARDPALLRALGGGGNGAVRAAALRELFLPGKHVVRVQVTRGGRTLVDVGGRFVVGGVGGQLHGGGSRSLGLLEISMQDVLGYRKLVHRMTGAQIVVRGRPGHVETSLPAAARVSLPSSGTVSLQGRTYVVRQFQERGFGGEQLRVWLLVAGS